MFVWGVPAGAYTVTPYFGPSTQRDSIGGIVDTVGDPVGWVVGRDFPWMALVDRHRRLVSATAHLAQWKQAESSSVDFYSFLRSSYYQTRRNQLREALGLPPGGRIAGHGRPGRRLARAPGASRRIAGLRNPAASIDGPYEVELA